MTNKQKENIKNHIKVYSGLGITYFTIAGVVNSVNHFTDNYLILSLLSLLILFF